VTEEVEVSVLSLAPGMRFVFDEEFGGEGDIVTVAQYPMEAFGLVDVPVEEYDFHLSFMDYMKVRLAQWESSS
jgi:hypothetical protein